MEARMYQFLEHKQNGGQLLRENSKAWSQTFPLFLRAKIRVELLEMVINIAKKSTVKKEMVHFIYIIFVALRKITYIWQQILEFTFDTSPDKFVYTLGSNREFTTCNKQFSTILRQK